MTHSNRILKHYPVSLEQSAEAVFDCKIMKSGDVRVGAVPPESRRRKTLSLRLPHSLTDDGQACPEVA